MSRKLSSLRSRRPRTQLFLEALEDRTTPANLNWIGPQGGVWTDQANWLEGVVAGPGDTAYFGVGDNPHTGPLINTDVNVHQIVFGSGYSGTFLIRDARLTLAESFLGGDGTDVDVQIEDTISDGLSAGLSAADWIFISGSLTTIGGGADDVTLSAARLTLMSSATWAIPSGATSFNGYFLQEGTVSVASGVLSLSGDGWQMTGGSATLLSTSNILYSANVLAIIGGLIDYGTSGDSALVCEAQCPGYKLVTGGVMRVWSGGNRFEGTLDNGAGTLQFMNSSASLDIRGNYIQFLGTLEARVSGTSISQLFVIGNVTLNQTLRVIADGPIGEGASFTIIKATGDQSGDFTIFELPAPPPGTSWTTGWVWDPFLNWWEYRLEAV